MLLADIKKGQRAEIIEVKPSEFSTKLLEMGCIPGTEISLAFKAPLGDPLAFAIDGYYLSMRKSEARLIEVKPINDDAK